MNISGITKIYDKQYRIGWVKLLSSIILYRIFLSHLFIILRVHICKKLSL